MLEINDENAPAAGERRAPSTATGAASIQLFATPPDRRQPALRERTSFVDIRPPDLVSDIEQMLARGELGDRAKTTRDGRRVRVLTGYLIRGEGRGPWAWTEITYVVDAATFAPIWAKATSAMRGSGARASLTARFRDYKRIPLTRDSARLLEIDAAPGTKVVERTIEQIKNP
jgi:hypothetical protein